MKGPSLRKGCCAVHQATLSKALPPDGSVHCAECAGGLCAWQPATDHRGGAHLML